MSSFQKFKTVLGWIVKDVGILLVTTFILTMLALVLINLIPK